METFVWILVIAGVVLVLAAVWAVDRSARSRRIRRHFGAEYEREVERADGDRRQAEVALSGRLERWRQLDLQPLSPAASDAYQERWEQVQAEFVDQPEAAVAHAQSLLDEVMTERGYPAGGAFDERAELVSVEYPGVVEHYRTAYRLHHDSDTSSDATASTEDRRQAVVHYRELFTILLGSDDGTGEPEPDRGPDRVPDDDELDPERDGQEVR